ncbi:MAG: ABC transporter ATP-binding protein [Ruminococcaceae bacterium]|nr:ABC transporter ATP-binding protein [Oscillospiraceae bacterium]
MEILKIENLTKIYGSGENAVTAIDNVSFSVDKGQMVAVIGPSGSGKSTLLHAIGGVEKPTSGSILVSGEDVYKKNDKNLAVFRRRQVGLIYQFYNLIPVLTAKENITLPVSMDGRKSDEKRLTELAALTGIEDKLNCLPSQLSGGQQQRVSVCRALYSSPTLLLADEPTGNLDSKNSREIVALLCKMNKELKQTTILITHDEDIALQCDRIIALEDGRIVRDEVIR